MDALLAMVMYVIITVAIQLGEFAVYEAVHAFFPAVGATVLLFFFLAAFWLSWPLAVRATEFVLAKLGRLPN